MLKCSLLPKLVCKELEINFNKFKEFMYASMSFIRAFTLHANSELENMINTMCKNSK